MLLVVHSELGWVSVCLLHDTVLNGECGLCGWCM